jgi:DNA polymerase-1
MLRYTDEWNDTRVMAFDFETSGTKPEYALQPWRVAQGKSWTTSLVYCVTTETGQHLFGGGLDPSVEMMRAMLQKAIDEDLTIVGWNTPFDVGWLIAYGLEDLVMRCNFLDAMLLWRHAEIEPEYEMTAPRRKSYSLKAFVREYMPAHAGYEDDIDFHDASPQARATLHAYNQRDVEFTLAGARHWWNTLSESQRRSAVIEARTIPLTAGANLRGIPVDTLCARELDVKLENDAILEGTKLAFMGVDTKVLRSPLKLSALMFDEWKLPVLKENKSKITGNVSRSTDKEVLHELAFIDPRAQIISAYREAENNRTKFAATPLASAEYNGDGRVHPSAIIFGTYSGRVTYASKQRAKGPGKRAGTEKLVDLPTGFAIHQEKRGALFRSILIPPAGYGLMEFDAAGQEFRWMAIASGDTAMLQLCLPGEDPHSFMGSRISNVDYRWMIDNQDTIPDAKNGRQLGKVANLSLQYRTSPGKLRSVARVQYNIPMELPEARRIHTIYQRTYPGVPKYWDRQIHLTKTTGYVETFAGRRVQVIGSWSGNFGWSMGSTAVNYRIQGTGADQKYLALAVIKPYLTQIGAYFAWDLHDGIYLFVPHDKMQQAAIDIKYLLDNLPYQKAWGFTPPIPMPWDAKMGYSWGDLKKVPTK